MVIIRIKDMDGAVNGLATTGTATIILDDINDNPPSFNKTSVSVTQLIKRQIQNNILITGTFLMFGISL